MLRTMPQVINPRTVLVLPLADFDESDVLFFIDSLMEQNSALVSKLGQIENLMNLAQEAVLEAGQRVEAAKEESNRIIAEARES